MKKNNKIQSIETISSFIAVSEDRRLFFSQSFNFRSFKYLNLVINNPIDY